MSSESAASAPAGMASYTCIACRVAFKDADVQRAHYKTDWHRYNLKRKVADMPPVTAENFQERVLAQRAGLEEQNKATATYCTACSKRFSNFNAYENHLKSKKHLELEKKAVQAVSKKVELMNEKNLEKGLTQENVDKDAMNAAIQQAIKAQPSSSPKKTSGLASNTAGSPVAAESSSSQQNRERAEKPPRVHWFEQQVKKLARESEDEGQEEEEDMEEGWEDVNSDEDVESEEEQMEGNDKEVEESAAGQSHLSADAIPVTNCLFCSHHSSSLMKNVAHMTKDHSFFIPDIEYLVDLRGLIKYLGEKVGIGKVCLWCNEKGKSFYTTESVQAHMNDKSHCKLFTEGDAALEFADFYDFRSSYPDYQEGEDAEMSKELPSEKNIEYDDESMELILPSATCPTRSFPTPCSPCSFSSPQDRARSRYRGSFRGFLPDSWTQHHRSRYCELKQDPWCRFRPRSPRYAPYHWEHKGHCGRDWEQYSTMSSQHHPAHQACQCSSWDLNLPPRPLAPSATVSCPPAASTAPPSESALQPSASVVIQPPIPRPLAQPVGTTLPPSTKLLPSEGTLPWFQHDTLASSSHSKMEDPASDSDDSNKALEFSPNHPAIFARALYPTEEQLIRMGNSLGLQVKQQSPLSKDPILRLIADLETSVALPMLPALLDVVKESWGKPAAVPPTSKRLDHLYRVQQKECDFLFTHPSPNSMVVEFSPRRGRRASLSVPSDKEGRKLDGMGKKVYALASTSLKIANHMACMGSFQHFLWEKISPALDHLPEDVKQMAMSVKDEALMLSKQQIAASRHIVDCGSKSLAAAVALRRHAWLRSSSFPPDAKAKIEDLPFEGEGLFSNKTDETLEKMAKLKRLARSLSLNRRT